MSGAGLEDTWNLPAVLFGPPATVPAPDPLFAESDHRDRSGRALLGANGTTTYSSEQADTDASSSGRGGVRRGACGAGVCSMSTEIPMRASLAAATLTFTMLTK